MRCEKTLSSRLSHYLGRRAQAVPNRKRPRGGGIERESSPRRSSTLDLTASPTRRVSLDVAAEIKELTHLEAALHRAHEDVIARIQALAAEAASTSDRLDEATAEVARARREREEETSRLHTLDELKDELLAAVSHDIRTCLTTLHGYAVLLERMNDGPPQDRLEALAAVRRTTRKLDRVLANILDVDRLRRGVVEPRRRPTDLLALVGRVVEEADVDRTVSIEGDPLVVGIDPAKIERIVENLLVNAVRHTPEGTRVRISLSPYGAGALIAVDDTGPGVPDDIKQAIFEPFERGPEPQAAPGTGLGLSVVARFAELHGGHAWVEDAPQGGASFRVFLPDA
jgi:signal transduction histidine kinase